MKKTLVILLTLIMILSSIFCFPVSAASANTVTETSIEYLENGDYIETVLTYEEPSARATNKAGSKTKKYKSSSTGEVLWSVTVRCTFTYNGSVSACTSASYSTTCPGTYWSIKSASASRAGNTGTATATATYNSTTNYTMSVSLSCSTYGELY